MLSEVGVVKGSGRVTDLMLWLPKARLMQHFRQWKVLEEAETAHLEASVKRTNSLMSAPLVLPQACPVRAGQAALRRCPCASRSNSATQQALAG